MLAISSTTNRPESTVVLTRVAALCVAALALALAAAGCAGAEDEAPRLRLTDAGSDALADVATDAPGLSEGDERGSDADAGAEDLGFPELRPVDGGADADLVVLGEFGDPCREDRDCVDGFCIGLDSSGSAACTSVCADSGDCPADFVCRVLRETGGDAVRLCVPGTETLCQPCERNTDCGTRADTCVEQDDGRFCATDCSVGRVCPEGFTCNSVVGSDGDRFVCEPVTGACGDGGGGADAGWSDADVGSDADAGSDADTGSDADAGSDISEEPDVIEDPVNECGGTAVLDGRVGDACGPYCGTGRLACASEDTLVCTQECAMRLDGDVLLIQADAYFFGDGRYLSDVFRSGHRGGPAAVLWADTHPDMGVRVPLVDSDGDGWVEYHIPPSLSSRSGFSYPGCRDCEPRIGLPPRISIVYRDAEFDEGDGIWLSLGTPDDTRSPGAMGFAPDPLCQWGYYLAVEQVVPGEYRFVGEELTEAYAPYAEGGTCPAPR